jgi:hypothetical protein
LVEHDLAKVGVASSSLVCRSIFYFDYKEKHNFSEMNLYVRYFEREAFFGNVDEALAFLSSIPDIVITPEMEADIRAYANGDVYYPKRYKVRPRIYFIMIKTDAKSMSDFKQKKALRSGGDNTRHENPAVLHLNEEREGWYEGQLTFKRVVLIPATGKHEYRDTRFVARCKALSGVDCYNRVVDYLRQHVDNRSQFPSAKGKNFQFSYLGMWK